MPNLKSPKLWLALILLLIYTLTFGLLIPLPLDEIVVGAILYYTMGR